MIPKELLSSIGEKYKDLVKNQIGIDVDGLTLKCSGAIIKDCSKCLNPLEVKDCGLHEDNIALYWVSLYGKFPTSSYCAGIDTKENPKYVFCYNFSTSTAIESAIKVSDKIRTAAYVAERAKKIMQQRLNHGKKVTDQYLERILYARYLSQERKRQKMWREIDDNFKKAARGGKDIIATGHYHLLAVLHKFGAIAILTGTFLDSLKFPRERGFLSNLGAPIIMSSAPIRILIKRGPEGTMSANI